MREADSIARAVGSAMSLIRPIRPGTQKAAAREKTRETRQRTLVQCVNLLAGSCRGFLRPGRPRETLAEAGSRGKARLSRYPFLRTLFTECRRDRGLGTLLRFVAHAMPCQRAESAPDSFRIRSRIFSVGFSSIFSDCMEK